MPDRTNSSRRLIYLKASLLTLILALVAGSRLQADSGSCGGQTLTLPFTDVMGSSFFCSIAEIYFQGITFGTTPTTYSPSTNVTRDQMAAFLSRTLDTGLQRGSKRAALDQFWTTTPHYDLGLGVTGPVGPPTLLTHSDGLHVWVAGLQEVHRVRASDGKLLDSWTGATGSYGVLCAMGRVFVTGGFIGTPALYMIDPAASPGPVTTVATILGNLPKGIAFDGNKIWLACEGGFVSIVTPGSTIPWSATNVGGFLSLKGIVYDGANMWVTEYGGVSPDHLKKLDSSGNVLQTVTLGSGLGGFPVFDGMNIWVPNESSNSVTVVRASSGEILATLSGNGLNHPTAAAFDGERILVTNNAGDSVSLWKATDLTPLGTFSTGAGTHPVGACSDGQYFWIALNGTGELARF